MPTYGWTTATTNWVTAGTTTGSWTYRYTPQTTTSNVSWTDCCGQTIWYAPVKEKEINIDEDSLLELLREDDK